MQIANILVVDDERNILRIVATTLKAEHYDVTTAQSAEEAAEKFRSRRVRRRDHRPEALTLRAGGSVSLGVSIAWSDVLTAGLKAVSSLLRAATPVNITISTGITAGLDVTLGGEFLIVFSVGDDKSLRLSLRKASTRGLAGTVTAGLSARFGNLDKALLAVLDSLVAGDFRKVLARVENAKAGTPTPSEQQLFDALVSRLGLQGVVQEMPDLAKWLASLQWSVRDAIRKAAETRIQLGFSYEYSRTEK